MKEYSIRITTNAWNALRYFLFTLVLVPAAEKLWALAHSRRTAERVLDGQPARLRQSRLAYWGLHQEIDETSRMSRTSFYVVCVLYIAGALILEYGSGSKEIYVMQNSMLSRSLRGENGLREDRVYFIDAAFVLGKPFGSSECIDGSPRKLSDFGLRVSSVSRDVSFRNITLPSGIRDVKAQYVMDNSLRVFQMFDNGTARWYGFHKTFFRDAPSVRYTGFANENFTCQILFKSLAECSEKKGNADDVELLSNVLAETGLVGSVMTKRFLRLRNMSMGMILDNVSIQAVSLPSRRADAAAQTPWLRRGMPREQIPKDSFLNLILHIKELKDGCQHKHAIPVSNLQKLENLKVLDQRRPNTVHSWQGDHKMIIWSIGNTTGVGTLAQTKNEYCSLFGAFRICVKCIAENKHELALYRWKASMRSFEAYLKVFNFSLQGKLRKKDAFDLAVQANVEIIRPEQFGGKINTEKAQQRVAKLIESGTVFSGLVRVAGEEMQGKSVLYKSNIATVNILFFVGTAILMLLLVSPIPILSMYRRGAVADVESSYRRAVMKVARQQYVLEVPDEIPIITAIVADGNRQSFRHAF